LWFVADAKEGVKAELFGIMSMTHAKEGASFELVGGMSMAPASVLPIINISPPMQHIVSFSDSRRDEDDAIAGAFIAAATTAKTVQAEGPPLNVSAPKHLVPFNGS
jgi:hypothetical protein